MPAFRFLWLLGLCVLLGACASDGGVAPKGLLQAGAWATAGRLGPVPTRAGSGWHEFRLPGKLPNQYSEVQEQGRVAMRVESRSSVSMLRHLLAVPPGQLGMLRFSWKVPALIAGADMSDRDLDDSPVRVVLAFDGDRSRLSGRNQMLSELARALTGEEMPYATLMYVWANEAPLGTVIRSPRTDRIRKIVLESGPLHLNQWRDFERDIRADYFSVFGEAPGTLIGVGIMSDTDNTRSQARAWYGPISLLPAVP